MVANGFTNYSLPSAKTTQYLTPPRISRKELKDKEPDYTLDHQEVDYESLELPELLPGQVLYLGESIPKEMVRCLDEIYNYIFIIRNGRADFVTKDYYDMHHIIGRSMIKGYYRGLQAKQWMNVSYSDLLEDLSNYYNNCPDSLADDVQSGHRILNLIPLPYWFHHTDVHTRGSASDYTKSVSFRMRNEFGEFEEHKVDNYPQLLLAINIFTIDMLNSHGQLFRKYSSRINEVKSIQPSTTEQYERQLRYLDILEFIQGEIQIICKISHKLKKRHPELYRIWKLGFVKEYAEA